MPIKGDLSQDTPDEVKTAVKELLAELGNPAAAIPFYAFFPVDGDPVVIGDAPILQGTLIERLEQALGGNASAATASSGHSTGH